MNPVSSSEDPNLNLFTNKSENIFTGITIREIDDKIIEDTEEYGEEYVFIPSDQEEAGDDLYLESQSIFRAMNSLDCTREDLNLTTDPPDDEQENESISIDLRDLPEIDLPQIISEMPLKDNPVVEFIQREELIIKDEQPDFIQELEHNLNLIEQTTIDENQIASTEENKTDNISSEKEITDENEQEMNTSTSNEHHLQEINLPIDMDSVDVKNEDLGDAEIVNEVFYSDEDVVFSQDVICSNEEKEDDQNEDEMIILATREADPENPNDSENASILDDHSYNKDHFEANFETIKNMKNSKLVSSYLSNFIKLLTDKLNEQNEQVDLALEDLEKIEEAVLSTVKPKDNDSSDEKTDQLDQNLDINSEDLQDNLSENVSEPLEFGDFDGLKIDSETEDEQIIGLKEIGQMMIEKSENYLKELKNTSASDIKEDLDKFVKEIRNKINNTFPQNNEISTQTNDVDFMLEEENKDELNEEFKNKLLEESSSTITTSDEELYTSDDSGRNFGKRKCRKRRQKIKHNSLVNGEKDENMDISISNDLDAVSEINEEKAEDKVEENSTLTAKEDVAAKIENEQDAEDKEIARLCNLSYLDNLREANKQLIQVNKKIPPKKLKEKVDVLENTANSSGSDSLSSCEEEDIEKSEQKYLKNINENMKHTLLLDLSTASSSSESEDEVVDDKADESNSSSVLIDKFLESLADAENVEEEEDEADKDDASKNKIKVTAKTRNDHNYSSKSKIDNKDKHLFSDKLFDDSDDDDETIVDDAEIVKKADGETSTPQEKLPSVDLDLSMFTEKVNENDKEVKNFEFDFSEVVKKPTNNEKPKVDEKADYISLSSDSDCESSTVDDLDKDKKKRSIRALLTNDQLADETKKAQKAEESRIKRLNEKHDELTQVLTQSSQSSEVSPVSESDIVLDYDPKKQRFIRIHPDLVKLLKPHQVDGVKFMYDCTYGSVKHINKYPGSGCILSHMMGLGKTLQTITLLNTVIRYPQLKTHKVMVICPKSTVINWSEEIQKWLGPIKPGPRLKVFYFPDNSDINDKVRILHEWSISSKDRNGCLLIGYEAFRSLVQFEISKRRRNPTLVSDKISVVQEKLDNYLLKSADLLICDEGHIIKNPKSAITKAVCRIKTRRRIILTGTPIQNNLKEYYCMVEFIKPSFLGTEKEFNNLYVNPIKNGQHKDSDGRAIKIMKQRSYVLHKKLSKFVQRREASVLKDFLPEKFEYVLFVPLTSTQEKLYEIFLNENQVNPLNTNVRGKTLLPDYTALRKIWTHPKVLETAWLAATKDKNFNKELFQKQKERKAASASPSIDEDEEDIPDDIYDTQEGNLSVTNDWWRRFVKNEDLETLMSSNKLQLLFEILKMCGERGEKCLVFSAFVAVLNVVEYFMKKINEAKLNLTEENLKNFSKFFSMSFESGKDYYRIDGKTQKTIRHQMITSFNNPLNKRCKFFLISSRAGGQGINLIGANRVIILDTSWNPSSDQQNIFRIYRLGQQRKCYVYRLLAMGTMEEKVYSRSVTKQAMSFRVVDEQQVDRHYNMAELEELYTLTKLKDAIKELPKLPLDELLANLLRNYQELVFKYHEHDSLLENKPEQDLSEDEKKEAWLAYEREITREKTNLLGNNMDYMGNYMNPNPLDMNSLNSIQKLTQLDPFGPYQNPYSNLGLQNNYYAPYGYQSSLTGNPQDNSLFYPSLTNQYNHPMNSNNTVFSSLIDYYNQRSNQMFMNNPNGSMLPPSPSTSSMPKHPSSNNNISSTGINTPPLKAPSTASVISPSFSNLMASFEKQPASPSASKNLPTHLNPTTVDNTSKKTDKSSEEDGLGIKPHVIVRDPSAINKSVKEAENVVKRINMGIVYPEKQKVTQNEDVLAMAKSITYANKRSSPSVLQASPSSSNLVNKTPAHTNYAVKRSGESSSVIQQTPKPPIIVNKTPAHKNYLPNKMLPSKVNQPSTSINQQPVNHKTLTKIVTSKPMPGKPQIRIVSSKVLTSNVSQVPSKSPATITSPVTKTSSSSSPSSNASSNSNLAQRPVMHRRPQSGNIVLPKNIVIQNSPKQSNSGIRIVRTLPAKGNPVVSKPNTPEKPNQPIVTKVSSKIGQPNPNMTEINRKRKADSLLSNLVSKNNSITISEVRSLAPPLSKRINLGTTTTSNNITITPIKQSDQNVIELE